MTIVTNDGEKKPMCNIAEHFALNDLLDISYTPFAIDDFFFFFLNIVKKELSLPQYFLDHRLALVTIITSSLCFPIFAFDRKWQIRLYICARLKN